MDDVTSKDMNLPVVIGFDGTERTLAALRYGLAEAERRSAPVRVVHVAPDYGAAYRGFPEVEAEVHAVARSAADLVAAEVEARGFVRPVDFVEAAGSVAEQIIRRSSDAQLVVIGHEGKTPIERLVTGATTGTVAGRSQAPTVAVPEEWAEKARQHGRVVVALRDAGHADTVLEAAFAQACARGAELHVLHAWALPSPYADRIEFRTHADSWDRAAREMVRTALDDWQLAYPTVPVTTDVVHRDPVEALTGASESSDLLLILRRQLPVLGAHLGHVGRAVLRSAACPVEVVPAKATLALAAPEHEGAMLR